MLVRQPAKQVVYAPVAKATIMRSPKPVIKTLSNGNIRVRHSEYIGEVFGSVTFNANTYVVQPGFVSTFPWLSLMAPLYESYKMHNCAFKFLTEKSTATNGTVIMAVDYDVQDAVPLNKTSLLSYANATRTQPWADAVYNCNPSDMNKFPERYVRTAAVAASDLKTFDVGNLFVATQGCADTSVLGELHVSYDIEFKTPQLDLRNFASSGSNYSSGTVGITSTLILGNAPILNAAGSGLTISYNTSTGAFTLNQVGTYLIVLIFNATATSGATICTATGGSLALNLGEAGSATRVVQFSFDVKNATDTFTFSGLAFTNPTLGIFRAASFPYGL